MLIVMISDKLDELKTMSEIEHICKLARLSDNPRLNGRVHNNHLDKVSFVMIHQKCLPNGEPKSREHVNFA